MPKVTQALSRFLAAQHGRHNGPDLLARWSPALETQVNVSAGDGHAVDGKKSTYTDGVREWFSLRIPRGANSEPTFDDYDLQWPLEEHAEAIGCTGWDWKARRSRWVGFDFDSIAGHAAGIGVSDAELGEVKDRARALPWVEVRRSTRGRGIHLYVYFDVAGIPTDNHTEHAALGRAILGMMSSETGFDFATQVDAAGGNMWIWSRHATPENGGLGLEKAAECVLSLADVPSDWRAHVDVVKRRRSKIRVEGVSANDEDPFEQLTSRRRNVDLDATHKAIIDELSRSGFSTVWVPDHHLLQTHTAALSRLMEDESIRTELGLKGFFRTISSGNNPGEPNCFAFPVEDGGFSVFRFSRGVAEADTWEQDREGWTFATFNRAPDLKTAAVALGGIEDAEHNGFIVRTLDQASEIAEALGKKIEFPAGMDDREILLKASRDGRLTMRLSARDSDVETLMNAEGWVTKKNSWLKIFNVQAEHKLDRSNLFDFDGSIRALVVTSGDRAGWMIRHKAGDWNRVPKDDARSLLLARGLSKQEADVTVGRAIEEAWRLVNLPFQPEYPGDRQWNVGAPQYRYRPAELDDEAPYHPHWNRIFTHLGCDLDAAVLDSPFCRDANIRTGADYLLAWTAIMLRHPFHQLPYLFFYGPENCGKSILHEALGTLITSGYVIADRALTNQSDFNGELAGAILCVVEEKDISISPGARNKLKEFVTSETLSIRKMRTDSFQLRNMTHWLHCANSPKNLPVFPNDTRIVVVSVPPLMADIPKKELLKKLDEEAPHFMRTIMDLPLPIETGRLWLPVLRSESKRKSEESNRTSLEIFLEEKVASCPGNLVPFPQFYETFCQWCDAEGHVPTPKVETSRSLPSRFPYGIGNGNIRFVANLALTPDIKPLDATPWIAVGGRIRRQFAAAGVSDLSSLEILPPAGAA